MELKTCTKCNRELTIDKFGKHKGTKDNLNCRCKECCNKQSNTFREENPEKSREMKKKYRDNNVDKTKLRKKVYYTKNKTNEIARSMKWKSENKDKVNESNRKYYNANTEKENERRRVFYVENFKKESERHKKYNAEHLVEFRKYNQNRRAIKLLLPSTFTVKQWKDCKLYFSNKCCYCGKDLPLVQEHFIALSKGGEYTTNNIVPSCQSCNSSKGNKDFNNWYPKYKHYAKKREKFILEYLNYKDDVQQITFAI